MSIYSKDYNNQIMTEINVPTTPDALKGNIYNIIENSTSQKDNGGPFWGFFNDKKVSQSHITDNNHYKSYVTLYTNWENSEGTSKDENKQKVIEKEQQIVKLIENAVKVDDDAHKMSRVVKDNPGLEHVFASAEHDAKYISQLVNSKEKLEEQLKKLRDRKNKNKRTKTNLLDALKGQIEKQTLDHQEALKEIKQQTNKTMNEKTNEITTAQLALNDKIEEINTAINSLDDKDEIIKDLQSKMTAEDTKEIIDGDKEGILTTITRILPLSWKNAMGFNIGNIITTVKGARPYTPNDTVDYFLHNELFKNQNTEEPDTKYNYGVPIYANEYRTDGGRGNNINKKKTRNIKTKKQRNIKTKKQRIIKTKKTIK